MSKKTSQRDSREGRQRIRRAATTLAAAQSVATLYLIYDAVSSGDKSLVGPIIFSLVITILASLVAYHFGEPHQILG